MGLAIIDLAPLLPLGMLLLGWAQQLRDRRSRQRNLEEARAHQAAVRSEQLARWGTFTGRCYSQPLGNRTDADRRAWELLNSRLSLAQRNQLAATRRFDLVTPAGHHYRVRCTPESHNVTRFDPETKRALMRYCVLPKDPSIPRADAYLTQAMMLMINEDRFLRKAYTRSPSIRLPRISDPLY